MSENQVVACHAHEEWEQKIKEANESKKLVVIDFTASWCPPCRFIAPVFVELAKKFRNVIFFKIDVDELKEVSQKFSVEAMPTFVFLKEGEELKDKRIVGADKDKIEKTVSELSAEPSATA